MDKIWKQHYDSIAAAILSGSDPEAAAYATGRRLPWPGDRISGPQAQAAAEALQGEFDRAMELALSNYDAACGAALAAHRTAMIEIREGYAMALAEHRTREYNYNARRSPVDAAYYQTCAVADAAYRAVRECEGATIAARMHSWLQENTSA